MLDCTAYCMVEIVTFFLLYSKEKSFEKIRDIFSTEYTYICRENFIWSTGKSWQ
ncbi:hypothetical protein RUMHYD_02442 [Blautia hydrogenotrophica DSM 10507]|uniref:Uncharacterized protein n=1 Tax=Blautia hydrogenotrophica (strain DSM 10507 / JCM 14656 / S5a33) TaxID=476272 RepID=C0CNJ9_BLAHS|nr:hypothetical protein RUMHYD_02442 [Blautia hydrogenotrophica DSM 10507]